ncbi:MAG TPA: tRNA epoxyqueuosine(34) reductase QueG [Chitinophagales bacterium]|nr:tRNA epoxyqueuosine(34) reductase QueG [Chitinophagales bacterium]HRK29015.1 tRNA epoxyqueuosine(34) reductase QueG [Chitinophagales bacterium]
MPTTHTQLIKQEAYRLGFQYVGISASGFLAEEAANLEEWLRREYHGKMTYMENHFDKRLDTTKLVPGSKSVITLLYNYHNPQKQTDPQAPKISQYAYGSDYHHVLKDKLKQLLAFITQQTGKVEGRAFVDSAPVMERAWAAKSGTGWLGKNSLLITPRSGSYFFLAELILDLELDYDSPIKDYCGTCTRCIDACPTQAIVGNKIVDGSKCIAYFTIELKEELPSHMQGKMDNWMFGCDVCQEVCPWNRFAKPHNEPQFNPHTQLLQITHQEWTELTEELFGQLFKKSAVKRTKYQGLMRNVKFLSKKLSEKEQTM